ncbi:MAG TPA: gephyrin-like molybdotransferase Glp [Pirellulales bacterium]|jgi:molybdopterin molybdotransferase|nr:gephyrin-like molybdotransferase Glp [Pirellulales bacterium]
MISIEEALNQIRAHVRPLASERVPLADALDRVLAQDVASDIDSPPHDKSIVDGYAVRSADLSSPATTLSVLEEIVAGAVPKQAVVAGTATRIMTGAPVPAGADAVVMVEQTELVGKDRVRIEFQRIAPGQNIMPRAASMRRDETVLQAGRALRPMEIGLLAEVGQSEVSVLRRPRVAVLPTGNELVSPAEIPAAGQIRNSNGVMLLSAVRRAGGEPTDLGVGRDDRGSLRRLIAGGLHGDMLLISGGVSAGVLDLVPAVLAELGVRQVFHKVNIKPGKPLWFGVLETDGTAKLVFGLPGNPVSSLVCFELFVRPATRALAGHPFEPRPMAAARLSADFQQRGDRVTYHPARLHRSAGSTSAEPLLSKGSGDLRTLAAADGLIRFDSGTRLFKAGETVEIVTLD